MPRLLLLLPLLACLGLLDRAQASPPATSPAEIAAICDRAGAHAAQVTGVPLAVLRAIALTETGRRLDGAQRPWPWTVNMEGAGRWFDTRAEALAYATSNHERGARSYDVGCFQINYRWHGAAFASIEDMFDPIQNAVYAGKFLRTLYAETGSWSKSAGAYHSRTPKFATRYRARFDRILARINGGPLDSAPSVPQPGAQPPILLAQTSSGVGLRPPPPPPLDIAGPLTISPPRGAVRGSAAGLGGAGGVPLLQSAGRRLY